MESPFVYLKPDHRPISSIQTFYLILNRYNLMDCTNIALTQYWILIIFLNERFGWLTLFLEEQFPKDKLKHVKNLII